MLMLYKKFSKCDFQFRTDGSFIVKHKGKVLLAKFVSLLSQDIDYTFDSKFVFRITKIQAIKFNSVGVYGICNISILEK